MGTLERMSPLRGSRFFVFIFTWGGWGDPQVGGGVYKLGKGCRENTVPADPPPTEKLQEHSDGRDNRQDEGPAPNLVSALQLCTSAPHLRILRNALHRAW